MKKYTFTVIIFLLILLHTLLSLVSVAQTIASDNVDSPIRKYFTTKKILWTFDDYFIQADHHPPHKGFVGLTEKIIEYGGHVNIMVIFTSDIYTNPYNNEIRNYSVVDEFGWSQNKINKSLEFFAHPQVYPQCHGWNHTSKVHNNANMSFAYKLINHLFWNWHNNYNITPHFFLGPEISGNYNVTLALKHFSDKYWTVYGENFKWYNSTLFPNTSRDAPAVEYIGKAENVGMFDPLFGCNWGSPCRTIREAKQLFNTSSQYKEIVFIRGHPRFLNGTDQRAVENLTLWKNWIDWIYQEHDLININHTQAINYNLDRYHFKVVKNGIDNFSIDLSDCKFNHNVLFTNPYQNSSAKWILKEENGRFIGELFDDRYFELIGGVNYYLITHHDFEIADEIPGFVLLTTLMIIVIISMVSRKLINN